MNSNGSNTDQNIPLSPGVDDIIKSGANIVLEVVGLGQNSVVEVLVGGKVELEDESLRRRKKKKGTGKKE